MGSIGVPEVLLLVGAIVLLFGAKRLPEIARSLGKAKGEFKKGLNEEAKEEADQAEKAEPDEAAKAE